MLGPELETYGPNVKVAIIALILGLLLCLPFWFGALDANSRTGWTIFYIVAGFFALLVAQIVSARVWLHPDGISFRNIFGRKEMRWAEVERFYYSSHQVWAHSIPLGTFHQLKLVDEHGQKMSLGDRIGRTAELAGKLNRFTFGPLTQKATQRFTSGSELNFGAIRISKSDGLKIKGWFGLNEIPWHQLAAFHLDGDKFYFSRIGRKRPYIVPAKRMFNAAVLLGLLNTTHPPLAHH